MRKYIIIAITLLVLIGCGDKNVEIYDTKYSINGCYLEIYIIDNCEYIGKVRGLNSDMLTHKGNCKNKIHWDK